MGNTQIDIVMFLLLVFAIIYNQQWSGGIGFTFFLLFVGYETTDDSTRKN